MSGNPPLLLHPTFSTENLRTLADNNIEYQIGKLDTLAITSTRQFEGIVINLENHHIAMTCQKFPKTKTEFFEAVTVWSYCRKCDRCWKMIFRKSQF